MKDFFRPAGAWLLLVLGIPFLATACGEDEDKETYEDAAPTYVRFGDSSLEFVAMGGTAKTSVIGLDGNTGGYYCQSADNWCAASLVGNYVSVTVGFNTSGSPRSTIVSLLKSSTGGLVASLRVSQQGTTGGDTGGGNTGGGSGDNTGGGTGGNTGGGTGGTGGTTQKPAAPTSVYVANYGSVTVPEVRVSWGAVSGATSYRVYRSTSATGYYALQGSTTGTYYVDNGCKVGNTYYYKVTARNSAGESDYSNYAEFNFKDTRKPGPVSYGSCTVSGTTMTLRWSVPTDASYGKPTKALLRVRHPDTGNYVDLQELSGTATSVSFTYTPWANSDGYVYAGIILENENGTGGGLPKVYDTKNKKWLN